MAVLAERETQLLATARRGVLTTIAPEGRPRPVPITFAVIEDEAAGALILYSPLDEKPKSVADPRDLARVRDIVARPRVAVLVDHWSEDWTELRWVRLDGTAQLLEPAGPDPDEHRRGVELLRARYPQYATHNLEQRPMLRIAVERAVSWGPEG